MKRYWLLAQTRVNGLSLRERLMVFAAMVLLMLAAFHVIFLDPLLIRQKAKLAGVIQQQEQIKALQASMQGLVQSKQDEQHSPLRDDIARLKQQIQQHELYLQSRSDRLVEPGEMAKLLEQVLKNDDKLQLLALKTLPLSLLIEPVAGKAPAAQQIYKHGVQITVRGGYLDLLRYLTALEKLPAQMFWGEVSLSVEKHPDAVMTLTVYTLSMDKSWLTV
ncbi:MAG: type II secretion system protein GspM [Gallionella sp.]|jgi:MSHA biogenesis protein MshJ